ncbi:Zinc finger CCCH domain-containing protein 17 [Euphorbia peplus]|nr:Zinc finger CCCH domain-containing protein 17 [Euphorbia peplus]
MDTKIAAFRGPYGGPAEGKVYSNVVCQFWLAGKCNRNPCRFSHTELPTSDRELPYSNAYKRTPRRSNHLCEEKPRMTSNYGLKSSLGARVAPMKRPTRNNMSSSEDTSTESLSSCTEVVNPKRPNNCGPKSSLDARVAPTKSPSRNNMSAVNSECNSSEDTSMESLSSSCSEVVNSKHGDSEDKDMKKPGCQNSARGLFRMLAELKGHTKGICGIALPSGSDKLYSASTDGVVYVWDCRTGKSARTRNLGERIGCLLGKGSWVFVGLQNSIKAWNCWTKKAYTLHEQNESFGLVYAMDTTTEDMLFSGGQGGAILAWKGVNDKLKPFKLVATMKGHTATVTCLRVGGKRLYSGSMDGTIRVWDLNTLKCLQLLKEHTDVVTSLICWDRYILSCSLDKTIKVWGETEVGTVEVVYSHDVKHGAIALCGIDDDQEKKPVLLCSCNDGCVRQFDLPSFQERGQIYSKDEVRSIVRGPDGLFFSGDGFGMLSVWKLTESSSRIVPKAAT